MSQKSVPLLAVVLRNLRVRAGWTQVRLEGEAQLSRGSVCRLEKGDPSVDRFLLGRLAKVMGVADGDVERAIAALEQLPVETPVEAFADLPSRDRQTIETVSSRFSRNVREKARHRIESKVRARRWRLDRAAAGAAWQCLRKMPDDDRKRLVDEVEAFHTWAVVERLCEESARAAANDVEEAGKLARLARSAAAALRGADDWRTWLVGYSVAFEANACQASGDLRDSHKLFLQSFDLMGSANPRTPPPVDRTRPLNLHAVLLKYLGQFEAALAKLEEALHLARSPLQRARLLINRADVLKRKFQYPAALAALREARDSAEIAGDSRFRWAIAFNEATYLCEAGDIDGATRRLGPLKTAVLELGGPLDYVRVRWLTAKIAASSGGLVEACALLQEVWQAFAARQIWFDAALAVLELASLELERGRTREVKKLAAISEHVFAAQALPEERLATIRLFWDAASREAASAETARQLLQALRGAGRANAEAA